MDQTGEIETLVIRKGGGAASPPCSHTALLVLLQHSELLNSEETWWRFSTLGTSLGNVLNEARLPASASQLALPGCADRRGTVAEHTVLLVTVSPSKSKNLYPPFLCPISEPGKQ